MNDFEKLGSFYLGKQSGGTAGELLLYDARDLVTHAVVVGMTGSGKTGLSLGLLEEALLDGVPALVIDPKGDLGNLLLTFPALRGEDFAPWVNEDDARRAGVSVAAFAEQEADRWRKGLADSGQSGERIARLRAAADFAIYTPGSTGGLPVSILASFAAPPRALMDDRDFMRERIATTATSLLGLLGIAADPIQSREHILLSTLFDAAWKEGRDLDLAGLIRLIQAPSLERVGVLELETFFPAKDRFALAMALNNLLAAPGFDAWLAGAPLDVQSLLYTPAGKPRAAIFSIAHLADAERMFFVSLLLGQTLGWMRAQQGTTSLRALLVFDEVFGYLPPVANPPAKAPLLALLKQARAFGLGVVLATQNPVDLDYKALSNAGTWFVGRLQTERDRARLLDGLEGAAAGKLDRRQAERVIAGLERRTFFLHDVHEDAPAVFTTRWTMSYLRGPLTRAQIQQLTGARAAEAPRREPAAPPRVPAAPAGGERPVLPPDVPQVFLPARGTAPAGGALLYRPMLLGCATLHFSDAKLSLEARQTCALLAAMPEPPGTPRWEDARPVAVGAADLPRTPLAEATFAPLPAPAGRAKSYEAWGKAFADFLARTQKLSVLRSPSLKQVSRPEESERDFRVRLQQAAREARDDRVARLREKYAPRLAALQERIRRAEQVVARESEQASQQKLQSVISIGATVLGAFLGRRRASASTLGRATTAARGVSRTMREAGDVARATETVETLRQQLADLEAEFAAETAALGAGDAAGDALETLALKPKKANVAVELVALAWAPHWRTPEGDAAPAWE